MAMSTLKIAWRNLGRNKKRTGLALTAIALGQFTLVFVNCMMAGMYADMLRTITGPLLGHVQVHHPDWREERAVEFGIPDLPRYREKMEAIPGVTTVSPRVYSPVLAAFSRREGEPADAEPAMIVGVDVGLESKEDGILESLAEDERPSGREVVVGKILANRLGIEPGGELALIGQDADEFPTSGLYTIKGVVRCPTDVVNRLGVVLPLAEAQGFLAFPDQAHEIIIQGEDPKKADELAAKVRSLRLLDAARVVELRGGAADVVALAYSPDGRLVASAHLDGSVLVWDAEKGTREAVLGKHASGATCIAFSPEGDAVATGDERGIVKLWHTDSQSDEGATLECAGPVADVAFRGRGRRIAAAGADGVVTLWDPPARPRPLRRGEGPSTKSTMDPPGEEDGTVSAVALRDDGAFLALGHSDGRITVRRVVRSAGDEDGGDGESGGRKGDEGGDKEDDEKGNEGITLVGHGAAVSLLAFDPRGRRLVSASPGAGANPDADAGKGPEVIVWDLEQRKLSRKLRGCRSAVEAVAFSRDGKRIATGEADGTGRAWMSSSGAMVLRTKGEEGGARSVAFSPDGGVLAQAGRVGTIGVWDVTGGAEVLDWREAAPQLVTMIDMKDWVDLIFVAILFVAAAAGIANTMMMSTFERTREFGMLLSLGARPWRIVWMIFVEAMVLGLVGVAVGSVLGTAVVLITGHTGIDYGALGGVETEEFGFYGLSFSYILYPMFELRQVIYGVVAVMVTAILASTWPAILAARLEPAEAIKS